MVELFTNYRQKMTLQGHIMKSEFGKSSWISFVLFYLILVFIITVLDNVNGLLSWPYWGAQVGLVTVGVGIFAFIGFFLPTLTPTAGVLLAFTVGVLTIIPALLMGLGSIPNFWEQYFSIAGGMAAGSFLTFLFLAFSNRLSNNHSHDAE